MFVEFDKPNLRRRAAVEAEIEMCFQRIDILIARLDRADAASEDLEDDDPAGDPLDRGEAPTDNGDELLVMRPFYGPDQTRGPTNESAAIRARNRALYRQDAGGRA